MATADRILMLKLLGDTSSIDKSLRKTEGRLKGMGRSALSWGKAFTAGLVIEGIDKVTDALGDAWRGFREGEQAAAQLGTTWSNLGLDGSQLQDTIDAISRSTLKLGTDDTEAINAFNQALQNTGGKPTQAMQRLRIAQNLVANGSAPSLSSALKIIDRAASGSAATVRKFGLTSDTAAGRIRELGEKVKGAAKRKADLDPLGVLFNRMNEDLEGIVGSLASGDLESALTSMRDIGKSLNEFFDKVGPKVAGVLDKLTGGAFSDLLAKFQSFANDVGPKVGDAFDGISTAWEGLQPHLQNALTFIQPLIDIMSNAAAGGLGFVLDAVAGSLTTIGQLLKGDFSAAFETVGETVGKLGTDLNTLFQGLPDKFLNEWLPDIAQSAADLGDSIVTSAMTFVSELPGKIAGALVGEDSVINRMAGALASIGSAAGDIGKGILDGIIGWVDDIPDKVVGIIRNAVNAMIGVWNSLDFRIPRFDLPAIDVGFPDTGNGDLNRALPRIRGGPWNIFGGTGDLIPDIPKLARGGIVNAPTLAMIGEAGPEAVVPLGRGGGMGNSYTINVNVAPGGDLAEVGRQVVNVIKAYERRDGRGWRS